MSKQENDCSNAGPPGGRPKAKIVLPGGKVALLSPPLAQLPPLLDYANYVIDGDLAKHARVAGLADDAEQANNSAFPAGLAPRFEAALTAAGYRVKVSDRRDEPPQLRVDLQYYRECTGDARAFLRAVAAQPLGQLKGWVSRGIGRLVRLFPEARILVMTRNDTGADVEFDDLRLDVGRSVGLRAGCDDTIGARCLVSSLRWFETVKRGDWQIVVLLAFDPATMASEATRRTVLATRASRVYAFVSGDRRLQTRTRVRLEAISGPVIWSATPPAWSRRRRMRT
jgi:hypothetical protein